LMAPNEHVTLPPPSFEVRRFFYWVIKFWKSGALGFCKLCHCIGGSLKRQ
jgi:hypothetical protein